MAIAFVNKTSGADNNGATTYNLTALNTTSGNLIVVHYKHEGAVTTHTVTDTIGNTYNGLTARAHSNDDIQSRIYWAVSTGSNATNVITITNGAARPFNRAIAHQYSGCHATTPFDQENFGEGTGTALSTANVTTTVADEVLVAFSCDYDSSTYTQGANYNEQHDFGGTGGIYGASEDRIVSATGTYNATMTQTQNNAWVLNLATFKIAAAAGDTLSPQTRIFM